MTLAPAPGSPVARGNDGARRLLARRLLARSLALALPLGLIACDDSSGPSSNQLVVGALLSITGPGQTLGRTSDAALQLAADDLNAALAAGGSETRVSLRIEDTGLDPATALERARTLAAQGIRIFIGPQSSSEVAAVNPFADSAGVILLSQGSTAGSLAIPDDNVFRLVPDDAQEGVATVELMWEDGIRAVVPLWREDAGNQGLHDSVKELFEQRGGSVTGGAHYPPGTTEFSAQLQAIHAEVAAAIAQHGAGAVGVYLAAFEESATLFAQASQDPTLARVRWYGGDGTVQSAAVLANASAAAFAASVSFRAATYGLDDALLQQHAGLIGAIEARSGLPADAFTLAAYDALHLATLAYAQVGLGSIPAYRAELLRRSETYTGATGAGRLNPAGDRATGDYDFYQVCTASSAFDWIRVSAYRAAPGTVVVLTSC
jgi:branched-chain amino acid transport system substrate-binding protein